MYSDIKVRLNAVTERERQQSVAVAIQKVINHKPLDKKVVSSRYTKGLGLLSPEALEPLGNTLMEYVIAIQETINNEKPI